MGGIGSFMAIAVFLIVQGFEAKPIFMTNGAVSPIGALCKVTSNKNPKLHLADPEEVADASGWAVVGYGIDFVCGLIIWPLLTAWDLITIGGFTWADINTGNLLRIIACVFLLQLCLQQFLRRGGRAPNFGKKGSKQEAKA